MFYATYTVYPVFVNIVASYVNRLTSFDGTDFRDV
jgi:hypothetical protein